MDNNFTCSICKKEYVLDFNYKKHITEKHSDLVENILNYDDDDVNITKPIIKWVGGKTQIIKKIIYNFPTKINNYHEIFVGGGSVLLALLSYKEKGYIDITGDINVYDINKPLISLYKNIQSNPLELYDCIQVLISEFNNSLDNKPINRLPLNLIEAMDNKENYYFWIRSNYNKLTEDEKNSIIGSSMFVFLNKTCFRGVFRLGPHGFNVPYGNYKNPEIINKEHLFEIHKLIQSVNFICADFEVSLGDINDVNDFIYLDPPYAPETKTSFVKYTEKGFDIEMHKKLFDILNKLTDNENKFLLSNADVSLVRENFTSDVYNIEKILCKRSINSKNPESKTT